MSSETLALRGLAWAVGLGALLGVVVGTLSVYWATGVWWPWVLL